MKVIEPGHRYEVHNVDGDGMQRIEFVRRRGDDGRLILADAPIGLTELPFQECEGILGQELLRVLIDRTLYLNAEVPCAENVAILDHLRGALRLYEARAARRTIEKLPMPEKADACPICHHILCDHRTERRLAHG
jgi:hypothetical protein